MQKSSHPSKVFNLTFRLRSTTSKASRICVMDVSSKINDNIFCIYSRKDPYWRQQQFKIFLVLCQYTHSKIMAYSDGMHSVHCFCFSLQTNPFICAWNLRLQFQKSRCDELDCPSGDLHLIFCCLCSLQNSEQLCVNCCKQTLLNKRNRWKIWQKA